MKHEPFLEGWTFMSNGDRETNDNLEDSKRRAASRGTLIRKTGRTGIFTEDELTRLFNPELYMDKALRLFYVCCLTGALRTGEARGLRVKQILFDREALIVDGFVRSDGTRTDYTRLRPEEHPKFRIVPLPDITLNLLREHLSERRVSENGFIFRGQKEPDKPVTAGYVQDNLKHIMKKAGIEPNGRKLMVQSFRFTAIMIIRQIIPADTAMKPVVHRNIRPATTTNGTSTNRCPDLPGRTPPRSICLADIWRKAGSFSLSSSL
jgi:integrase